MTGRKRKQWWRALCVLGVSGLMAAGFFVYIRYMQQGLWQQAVSEIVEVTSQGSHAFEVYVEKDFQMLSRIVKQMSTEESVDAQTVNQVISFFEDHTVGFTITDLDHGVMYGGQEYASRPIGAEERALYETFLERGLREPYQDAFTGEKMIGGYLRFDFADGCRGIAQVKRGISSIAEEFMLSVYDDEGVSYIVNQQGDVLVRPNGKSGALSSEIDNIQNVIDLSENSGELVRYFFDSLARGEEGALRMSLEGVSNILAFTPIQGSNGWYLITVIPNAVVTRHADRVLKGSQVSVILLVCIFSVAGLFLYAGQRSHQKIMEKEDNLLYQEQLFNILANNTNDVFLMFSADHYAVEYVSPNVERVLGIPAEEIKADIRVLESPVMQESGRHVPIDGVELNGASVFEGERIHRRTGVRGWFTETLYRASINGSERLVAVIADRTHERMSEQALKDALEIAKNANESKSVFLSNMSHDIRTPMNAIVGFSTLLQRDANDPERVKEYTRKIAASSQHLLGLINDVLDMSKIESGKTTLNISEISLAELVDELATMIQPQARAKRQDFRIAVYDICNEAVLGDRLRINQILINILSNAVKYTPEGGQIEMTVRQMPQYTKHYARFHFVIRDNGIGMTKDYLENIFQPFTRETNTKTLGIQGTGLGMAITKNLVDLMGGTIQVESSLGQGSTFTVDLELRIEEQDVDPDFWEKHGVTNLLVVDDEEDICVGIQNVMAGTGVNLQYALGGQAAVQLAQEAQEAGIGFDLVLIDWQMPDISGIETARRIRKIVPSHVPIMILTAYDISRIEEEGTAAGIDGFLQKPFFLSNFKLIVGSLRVGGTPAPELEKGSEEDMLTGRHILAAEDNELNAEILMELLEMAGASCEVAKNGQEVLEKFERSEPGTYDVILMDVQMPVMNGYEATRAIRGSGHPEAKTIPIIAMTANAFSEDVKEALNAGMNEHIAKPIDMERLDAVIKALTSS